MAHGHRLAWSFATLLLAGMAGLVAQERVGRVSQPLVGGQTVPPDTQERYALVTLSTGCSGSLLRNAWVLTAAHCIDNPDPNRPGAFIQVADTSVTVSAAWRTPQQQRSLRIISFRPIDVAIIRVAAPFTVQGSTRNYNRGVFRDGQFPYFGTRVAVPIMAFGRGINQFASSTTPTSQDGQFRVGYFKTTREANDLVWYPSTRGQHIGGGDSGGPSIVTVLNDEVVLGVHSLCTLRCAAGQACGDWKGPGAAPAGYAPWMWVADTMECADAPVEPVWDDINRYLGAYVPDPTPALEPPPAGFIGTFGTTAPDLQPLWVYGAKDNGDLLWYRKDSGRAPWQGPVSVGAEWNRYLDVIPAGGNAVYARMLDGTLRWFQHNGFNDGARSWNGPKDVGSGWAVYKSIVAGGEGIVYAIRNDGTLLWFRNRDYRTGPRSWDPERVVGSGWEGFKDVFGMGQGVIYAVRPSGELLWYRHDAYATGEMRWTGPRVVGSGWQGFKAIVPAGDGVILAIKEDGSLLWYRHKDWQTGTTAGLASPGAGRVRVGASVTGAPQWDGPVVIGNGWQGFRHVVALLPAPMSVVR